MTNQELIQEAAVIRDERNQYANTAERVGNALVHMAEQLAAQAEDVDKVEADVRGALTLAQLDNPLGFTTPVQWALGLRGEQSYTFRLVAASGRCIGHVWLFNDADHYQNSNESARVLEMVMCCATINAGTGALTYDAINGSPRIYYRSYIAAATGGGSPDGGNPGLFKWSAWQEYREYIAKPIKDALAALQQQHATDVAALHEAIDNFEGSMQVATEDNNGLMSSEHVKKLAAIEEDVAKVDLLDVKINGKPSISDVATITSPGWTKKPFDKVIPQGSVITAISVSQLYLYDIGQTSLGGIITPPILPYTVERDVHYATCSPTSKLSVTYEIEAVKGIVDELVDINSATQNNTDDISELNGEAYKPEVIESSSIDSSYQIIKASNRYDRVAKIKCKPNTRYAVSSDGQFNVGMGIERVVFYDKDGLLISGQEVLNKNTYVGGLSGRSFVSPDGAEYFIVSLTNTDDAFTTVRCDEYDKINNRAEINTLSVWVLGDSISATAYQTSVYTYETNANPSYGVGGWISMFLMKTSKRPLKWYNFANGGWFLGGNANKETKSFSRELEIAIRAYQAGTIDAPDVILSVGCTNDFDYITHQVTDEEITEGMTYDEYMEEQFVTVKGKLKPIENVNTEKLAGAMRYIVQRAGTLFPNCKFVFCTPSQSTLHNPINQMRCVKEMKWMANRLCVPIIDVWTEAQMPMLWDYYDADGTEHHRFLDDRVHTYNTGNGSNAIGWQRQGEYIARRFSEIFKDDMGLNY